MNNNQIAVIGFAIMSAIGVYLSFYPKFITPISVLSSAASAEATITNIQEKVYQKSGKSAGYQISYSFNVGNNAFSGNSAVDDKPSTKLTIWYMPSSPGINDVALKGHAIFDLLIFSIPFSVLVICSFVIWKMFSGHKEVGRRDA